MPNSEPTIKCSNPHCQASNSLKSRFCKRCKTPMIKRYLWAIGERRRSEEKTTAQINSSPQESREQNVAESDRYLAESDRIFLDTQPAQTPQIPEKLPPQIVNYLQLFTHFPYIPQVYGQLDGTGIWLLYYGTVPVNREGKLTYKDLLPTMTSLWGKAEPCKQLNWLRQLASLWQPLSEKGMVATLVNPDLIRVNGSLIQLIELEADKETPTLKDLGKLWKQWSKQADATIQDVLIQLSQRMENGSIDLIKQVIALLDRTFDVCSSSHEYSYEIFTHTDPGPKRSSNQDIAYPDSEIPIKIAPMQQSLTIVCDGVGGHEGGEIASGETVKYLSDRISALTWDDRYSFPNRISKQLIRFINEANDAISERNDSEQRLERQRMGTTLVMSLTRKHEVYLSHVGDSRIYLITNNSCHQITIDDDLSSREVRLGYAVYWDALQYPSGGALIQALGMRNSTALHPNVQRLTLDDDCILLLCSDGLSDFDRVEQYWRDVIVPVLDEKNQKFDLTKAVKTLIKIGNERNGHDNVTAALIHCRVKPKANVTQTVAWSDVEASLSDSLIWIDEIEEISFPDTMPTEALKTKTVTRNSNTTQKRSLLFIITLGSAFILSLGFLIYAYTQNRDNPPRNSHQSRTMLYRQ